jgi:hypothetical protein
MCNPLRVCVPRACVHAYITTEAPWHRGRSATKLVAVQQADAPSARLTVTATNTLSYSTQRNPRARSALPGSSIQHIHSSWLGSKQKLNTHQQSLSLNSHTSAHSLSQERAYVGAHCSLLVMEVHRVPAESSSSGSHNSERRQASVRVVRPDWRCACCIVCCVPDPSSCGVSVSQPVRRVCCC